MKFSYSFLKSLSPCVRSRDDLITVLNTHIFEAERGEAPDTISVDVYSNRYSSAASHWGLAREISAACGVHFQAPSVQRIRPAAFGKLQVEVQAPELCRRMIGWRFSDVKIGESPTWVKKVLVACGFRPINNLVDITNFVMLETGAPVHVFDSLKMASDKLIVRRAAPGEKVKTLDGAPHKLDEDMLVLADEGDPLDLAGIKGGKKAEVTGRSREILLTAGSFDGVSIYKTSRRTGLVTEAASRFAHNLAPELANLGASRAAELIVRLCRARPGVKADQYPVKPKPVSLLFEIEKFAALTGLKIREAEALAILRRLGFQVRGKTIFVPALRDDVTTPEDLFEEVVRICGYDKVLSRAPSVSLAPPEAEPAVVLKDRLRAFLTNLGFDEVYSHSFVSSRLAAEGNFSQYKPVPLVNPISAEYTHLRPSLIPLLSRKAEDGLKYFPRVKVFEIGNVFGSLARGVKVIESLRLGLAVAGKETKIGDNFFELKGVVKAIMESLGLTDFNFLPCAFLGKSAVELEADGKTLGYLAKDERAALSEIDLDALLLSEQSENEFQPLPRFPAVERDLSVSVGADVRIGEVMEEVELVSRLIRDSDLIDEYYSGDLGDCQSITLRIVFQADDRTLTGEEVDGIMAKILERLSKKFGAEVR